MRGPATGAGVGLYRQRHGFEEAISDFAVAYADQTEKDWNSFLAAIKDGRITAAEPETKED